MAQAYEVEAAMSDKFKENEGVDRFEKEIIKLLDYYRDEYDLSVAEAIGVLHLRAHAVAASAFQDLEED